MSHRIPSMLNVVAGIWLILAPFVLGYAWNSLIMRNDIVVGILVAALAAGRAFGHAGAWASWLNVVLGVWLLLSPYMYGFWGFDVAFNWNDVIMGVLIPLFAIWSAFSLPMNEWGGVQHFAATHPDEEELRRREDMERRRGR